jgi:hypothetical protein
MRTLGGSPNVSGALENGDNARECLRRSRQSIDIAGSEHDALPLWPAGAAALLLDGQTLRPLIRLGNQIWYPTMP